MTPVIPGPGPIGMPEALQDEFPGRIVVDGLIPNVGDGNLPSQAVVLDDYSLLVAAPTGFHQVLDIDLPYFEPKLPLTTAANVRSSGTWKTIRLGHRLDRLGPEVVVDWVPANRTWRLWAIDAAAPNDPLPDRVAYGTWASIGQGHRLLWLFDTFVLDWRDDGQWRLFERDDRAGRDPLPGPALATGTWTDIDVGHRLLSLDGRRVVDHDLIAGVLRVFDLDPNATDGDILQRPPLREIPWSDVGSERDLVALRAGYLMDWVPNTGQFLVRLRAPGALTSPAPSAPTVPIAVPPAGTVLARIVISALTAMGTPRSDAVVTATLVEPGPPRSLQVMSSGTEAVIDLPTNTARCSLQVDGPSGSVFPQGGDIAMIGGSLALVGGGPEVGPLSPAGGSGIPTFRLPVVLPRVRDVTARAEGLLGRGWQLSPLNIPVLVDPPPPTLAFAAETVVPGSSVVFEIADIAVPKLISVTWPPSGPMGRNPYRFLVYLHHRIGQNVGEELRGRQLFVGQSYPWGRDYLEFGFRRYLDYAGSPLSGLAGGKGLAYQLAASHRQVALVLPLPSARPDTAIGELADGTVMQGILQEVAAHASRRLGVSTPPTIDRIALASFSSGAVDSAVFVRQATRNTFCQRVFREAYRFEGVSDQEWLDAASAWAGALNSGYIVRIYRQLPWDASRSASYRARGFQLWPVTAERTFASLMEPLWTRVGASPTSPWNEVETLIANTMLVDALRRSDF